MIRKLPLALLLVLTTALIGFTPALAEEEFAANPEALFHSKDPKLDANKQLVYRFYKDIWQAGHMEVAREILAPDYSQGNSPGSKVSGNIDAWIKAVSAKIPTVNPLPEKLTQFKIVFVTAEDDLVTVAHLREVPAGLFSKDAKDPSRKILITWYDTFRVKNGKLVEHWDSTPTRD